MCVCLTMTRKVRLKGQHIENNLTYWIHEISKNNAFFYRNNIVINQICNLQFCLKEHTYVFKRRCET